MVGSVIHIKQVSLESKCFAYDEEVGMEMLKWLRQQS
jgi:hypothetical protein